MSNMQFPKLRKGRTADSIVYDEPQFTKGLGAIRPETLAFYGGQVAAESVPPAFQPLFIAAPDLLEALHGLLNVLPSATTHPAIKAARAAIEKATGAAPAT